MSDWSDTVTCPECGAGNPHDGKKCVKCGIALQEALAKDDTDRQKRLAAAERNAPKVGRRNHKPIDELTVKDFKRYPVWGFNLDEEGDEKCDETWVRLFKKLPVKDLNEPPSSVRRSRWDAGNASLRY